MFSVIRQDYSGGGGGGGFALFRGGAGGGGLFPYFPYTRSGAACLSFLETVGRGALGKRGGVTGFPIGGLEGDNNSKVCDTRGGKAGDGFGLEGIVVGCCCDTRCGRAGDGFGLGGIEGVVEKEDCEGGAESSRLLHRNSP